MAKKIKKQHRDQEYLRKYAEAFLVFVIFMIICMAICFYYLQQNVDRNIEKTIKDHVERQVTHIQTILDNQYKFLESAADHIASQSDLDSKDSISLLKSIYHKSDFEHMGIISADGTSYYDNGEKKNVKERRYFKEAMQGKRSMSDPVISKVDGQNRVILAVPVIKNKTVIGVLGASYNVAALSNMLFEDIFNGQGYCYIVDENGDMVSIETDKSYSTITQTDNFFTYYSKAKFWKNQNLDQIRTNFQKEQGGHTKFKVGKDWRYLTYEPLGTNNWILCYVVPETNPQEDYAFIQNYEILFSAAVALGILCLMLYVIHSYNVRQKSLIHDARIDSLTGCRNKKNTEDSINEWLSGAHCKGLQAFMIMDIDNFKGINDIYGHMMGDEVLRKVGKCLHENFREDDVIGRIGGDEFVVLMKNIDAQDNAVTRVEALKKIISEINIPGMDDLHLTVSMGMTFTNRNEHNFEELYAAADQALYKIKKNGKNGCAVVDEQKGMINNETMYGCR